MASAPPLVARYSDSFQSILGFRGASSPVSRLKRPSRSRETATLILITPWIPRSYPPAMSLPNPTFTLRSRASRSLKISVDEKYAFERGQWATADPVCDMRSKDGGGRKVQWACIVRGVRRLCYGSSV